MGWVGVVSVGAGLKQLKVISRGKTVGGCEFQSLVVIGIKDLSKALVRFSSNLTAKGVLSVPKPRVSSKESILKATIFSNFLKFY